MGLFGKIFKGVGGMFGKHTLIGKLAGSKKKTKGYLKRADQRRRGVAVDRPNGIFGKLNFGGSIPTSTGYTPPYSGKPISNGTGRKSTSSGGIDINGDGKSDTMYLLIGGAILAFFLMKKK